MAEATVAHVVATIARVGDAHRKHDETARADARAVVEGPGAARLVELAKAARGSTDDRRA